MNENVELTVAQIREKFPEFDIGTYPDTLIQNQIDINVLIVNRWQAVDIPTRTQISYYLVAHFVWIAGKQLKKNADNVSPTQSKSLGDASVTFQVSNAPMTLIKTIYDSSSYGQQCYFILKQWQLSNIPYGVIGGNFV